MGQGLEGRGRRTRLHHNRPRLHPARASGGTGTDPHERQAYDYNLARFLSVDPIIVDVGNGQALNPYSYIMNNPLSGVDPTGYAAQHESYEMGKAAGEAWKVIQFAPEKKPEYEKVDVEARYVVETDENGNKTATLVSLTWKVKPIDSIGNHSEAQKGSVKIGRKEKEEILRNANSPRRHVGLSGLRYRIIEEALLPAMEYISRFSISKEYEFGFNIHFESADNKVTFWNDVPSVKLSDKVVGKSKETGDFIRGCVIIEPAFGAERVATGHSHMIGGGSRFSLTDYYAIKTATDVQRQMKAKNIPSITRFLLTPDGDILKWNNILDRSYIWTGSRWKEGDYLERPNE